MYPRPGALLARAPRLTLDEIQRAPELLLAIKRAVDADRTPGRFLLTGSANLDLMKGVSETLAGRAVYVTLWPMTRGETAGGGSAGRWDVFLDEPPRHWIDALAGGDAPERWKDLARRGGYPFPALNLASEADRTAWFEAYLRTYLERDLRQLAAIENLLGRRGPISRISSHVISSRGERLGCTGPTSSSGAPARGPKWISSSRRPGR
ncbi:AAA family ATPase [Candidatus Palauibacter sp.]|uniref:AAA family ATPase n=1 Tax=Candidatus Palauibacter sp. TaxID=3101350 RepID=UPI003B5B960B